MMNINVDPIPLFDFKNGDEVTALYINTIAIEVYNKFNLLNPNNVKVINTGHFTDSTNYLTYPNYCGWMDNSNVREYEMDTIIEELTTEINKIIATYTGD